MKEFLLEMKNNKASGYDGIPADFWKIFRTVRDGSKTLSNMFNKIIAQVVSQWLPTVAAESPARVWSCGIRRGQSGAGVGFL
jgi:hypothetical protein